MKKELTLDLIRDEGSSLVPYTDTVGKLTIGVGRNLTDVGISNSEMELMLMNDIENVLDECQNLTCWASMSSTC